VGDRQLPLVSNMESVRRGRPSLLAMVETIIASGISIWLAWRHNSVEHIVIGSALAPFLLLRTRLSTWYTIRVINILYGKVRSRNDYAVYVASFLFTIIKIVCSIKVFVRRPLYSISSIPANFYKNVFVIDLFISPQLIPGSDEITHASAMISALNAYEFARITRRVIYEEITKSEKTTTHKITFLVGVLFGILILGCPLVIVALSFRYAIKSTAFVWLPLLWIIYQSSPGLRVLDRIDLNMKHPWSKLMLIYSIYNLFIRYQDDLDFRCLEICAARLARTVRPKFLLLRV
jgi:hypothetical protein